MTLNTRLASLRHLWDAWCLLRFRWRADIPLSEAAAMLATAIDRAGLQHVDLAGEDTRQDYRYVILTLLGGWCQWSPDKDRPDFVIRADRADEWGPTDEPFCITASDLRRAIHRYLDALRAWHPV